MGVKFSQLPIATSVASDDYIAVLDTSESVLKRTPISHASSGSQYGLGTTQAYGHTKIRDNLTQTSLTSGEALSSRQGNVIANDMGVVELSTKATHAHNVGDYFMLIGQFVKCTAKINVGNTINIGTNVVTTNIGEVLSQLNSKTALIGNSQIPSALGQTITGALANIPFPFGIDSDGNYGYWKAGADSVTPFKSTTVTLIDTRTVTDYWSGSKTYQLNISQFGNITVDDVIIECLRTYTTGSVKNVENTIIKSINNGVLTITIDTAFSSAESYSVHTTFYDIKTYIISQK